MIYKQRTMCKWAPFEQLMERGRGNVGGIDSVQILRLGYSGTTEPVYIAAWNTGCTLHTFVHTSY